jgi:hypothetical protein
MPKSTNLSFVGIGKETTPGTGVTATAFIPVTGPNGKDAVTMLPDKGLRGAMVDTYDEIAGPISGTYDFGGDVFPDTIGWPLAGILGDVATTGASAPYSHAMAALNSGDGQPKSYTISDFYSAAARQYPGAKFSEFSLKYSGDSMLTYTAKAVTFGSVTTTKPTAAFTSIPPMAGWTGAVKLAGTPLTNVLDGELNIKRATTVINPVDGTQAPSIIWSGPVTCDGKFTVIMEDDTYLSAYLANTSTTLEVNYQTGAGAALVQVDFKMSKIKYTLAEIDRSKDYVTVSVTWEGLANSTDVGVSSGYSPLKVTLQNAVTSGVYA